MEDVKGDAVNRLALAAAIETLDHRAPDLLALRYGAELTARQIRKILGLKTNAVEVALHRTLTGLRREMDGDIDRARQGSSSPLPSIARQ